MTAFYNDIELFCVEWLKNLSDAGKIVPGTVSAKNIKEINSEDLVGFRQAHFFAGLGGWSYAARLAGWPDRRELWTGSCPCQPFSTSGKGRGTADDRHLWPDFFRLIRERKPSVIFGEQVAGELGLSWLDLVFTDLESEGYACGAVILGAHSLGAPHKRQRIYWMSRRISGRVDDADSGGIHSEECADSIGKIGEGQSTGNQYSSPASESIASPAVQGPRGDVYTESELENQEGEKEAGGNSGVRTDVDGYGNQQSKDITEYWRSVEGIKCADGKTRLIKPGLLPLADGIPTRVGRNRAYGNAIVPQVAASFIKAFLQIEEEEVK